MLPVRYINLTKTGRMIKKQIISSMYVNEEPKRNILKLLKSVNIKFVPGLFSRFTCEISFNNKPIFILGKWYSYLTKRMDVTSAWQSFQPLNIVVSESSVATGVIL